MLFNWLKFYILGLQLSLNALCLYPDKILLMPLILLKYCKVKKRHLCISFIVYPAGLADIVLPFTYNSTTAPFIISWTSYEPFSRYNKYIT